MNLEQELIFEEEHGLPVESKDLKNFKVTAEEERLQAIGDIAVKTRCKNNKDGEEDLCTKGEHKEALGLSDSGSEMSFVTHSLAKKNNLRKLRILNVRIKTLGGFKNDKTFIYEFQVWNYKKKKYTIVEAAGINHIGRSRMMTRTMQKIVNDVL